MSMIMRSTAVAVFSVAWASVAGALSSDADLQTSTASEWTIVESHCWSDTKYQIRALTHHAVNWDPNCATVSKCLIACEAEGYCLAGLEYGRECWCGNVARGDVHPVPNRYCNFPCTGDYDEYCGGYGFMGLYIRRGFKFIVDRPGYDHGCDHGCDHGYPDEYDYELPAGGI